MRAGHWQLDQSGPRHRHATVAGAPDSRAAAASDLERPLGADTLEGLAGNDGYVVDSLADLVIEAVFEDLEVKRAVYGKLEPALRPGVVIATNTSSIPLQELSGVLAAPERLVGLHFDVLGVVRQRVGDGPPEFVSPTGQTTDTSGATTPSCQVIAIQVRRPLSTGPPTEPWASRAAAESLMGSSGNGSNGLQGQPRILAEP